MSKIKKCRQEPYRQSLYYYVDHEFSSKCAIKTATTHTKLCRAEGEQTIRESFKEGIIRGVRLRFSTLSQLLKKEISKMEVKILFKGEFNCRWKNGGSSMTWHSSFHGILYSSEIWRWNNTIPLYISLSFVYTSYCVDFLGLRYLYDL